MILNVVVFHVRDDVFRHCLTILHLELVRVLCSAQTTKIICDISETISCAIFTGKNHGIAITHGVIYVQNIRPINL